MNFGLATMELAGVDDTAVAVATEINSRNSVKGPVTSKFLGSLAKSLCCCLVLQKC